MRGRRPTRDLRAFRNLRTSDADNPIDRFLEKVDTISSPLGCWLWTAALGADGYGVFSVGGELFRSHRYVFTLQKIDIPKGHIVDHLCGQRGCCNPRHLEFISQKLNVIRGKEAARDGQYIIHEGNCSDYTAEFKDFGLGSGD